MVIGTRSLQQTLRAPGILLQGQVSTVTIARFMYVQ